MIYFVLVLALYMALCYWLVYGRGGFTLRYNPGLAWLLRNMGMQAITIGSSCYLFRPMSVVALTDQGYDHEHAHYDEWQRHPFTFAPVYLFNLWRFGYNKHPEEQRARAIAGEPLR